MLALLHCVAKSFIRRKRGFRPLWASGSDAIRWLHLSGAGAGALAHRVFGA